MYLRSKCVLCKFLLPIIHVWLRTVLSTVIVMFKTVILVVKYITSKTCVSSIHSPNLFTTVAAFISHKNNPPLKTAAFCNFSDLNDIDPLDFQEITSSTLCYVSSRFISNQGSELKILSNFWVFFRIACIITQPGLSNISRKLLIFSYEIWSFNQKISNIWSWLTRELIALPPFYTANSASNLPRACFC